MTCKYVSLGMNLGNSGIGKVSWLHDECAVHLNITLGPKAKKTEEKPPKDVKCVWCGKRVVDENRGEK